MVFYPDNQKRASRLQQLVDSMANMQTDVRDIGQKMDEKNTKYRPAIDKLLKANGMDSIDDVINKAASQMTEEERKTFEALIKTIRESQSDIDVIYFIGGVLILPEGAVLASRVAMAVARWGARIVNVNAMVKFFRATLRGTAAAAAAAEEIATTAAEVEKTIQEAGKGGSESGVITRAARVQKFCKFVAAVGFVITLVMGIIELVQGAAQKKKLIEAIHDLQPARLTTAFFKQEGTNIMQQLQLLDLYLDVMPGGSTPNEQMADMVSKQIIDAILEENKAIDLNKLESDLEAQDRTSSLFYGDDDLSHAAVVAAASEKQ